MSYLRKPDGQKCGKSCSSEEMAPKIKKQHHQMPASPAFMPLEDREDRASHDRHVKALQQECKNAKPSKQVSLSCMFDLVRCMMFIYICKFKTLKLAMWMILRNSMLQNCCFITGICNFL